MKSFKVMSSVQPRTEPCAKRRKTTSAITRIASDNQKKFMKKKGLSSDDLAQGGQEAFMHATGTYLTRNEQEAAWLKLSAKRKESGFDWQKGTHFLDVGSSLSWLTVTSTHFPCVLPRKKFLVLSEGQPWCPHGAQLLALQGVQKSEAELLDLKKYSSKSLQDYAGNMFTANILSACTLACLVVLGSQV